jgi:hypothetical protein
MPPCRRLLRMPARAARDFLLGLRHTLAPLIVAVIGSWAVAFFVVLPRLPVGAPAVEISVPDDPAPIKNRCFEIEGTGAVDPDWPLFVAQEVGSGRYQIRPITDHANGKWSVQLYFGEPLQRTLRRRTTYDFSTWRGSRPNCSGSCHQIR